MNKNIWWEALEPEQYKVWKKERDALQGIAREEQIFDYYSKLPTEHLQLLLDSLEMIKTYPGYIPQPEHDRLNRVINNILKSNN